MGGSKLNQLAGMSPAVMSIAMVAVLALVWGGVAILRRGDRQRGLLMLACAAVILGNVLIWTV